MYIKLIRGRAIDEYGEANDLFTISECSMWNDHNGVRKYKAIPSSKNFMDRIRLCILNS